MWPSPVFWRYLLFQVPGLVAAGIGLLLLVQFTSLSPTVAAWLWVFWFVKDLALYPRMRIGYESRPSPAGPDALLGAEGTTLTPLAGDRPGRVRVGPEQWKAELVGDTRSVDIGVAIRVVAVHGLTLHVELREP